MWTFIWRKRYVKSNVFPMRQVRSLRFNMRMKRALKVHKAWNVIDKVTEPFDEDKSDVACALLFQSIPEALALQIGELETTREVWDTIKSRHVGVERVKDARLQTLMAEFDRLTMKDFEKI